MSTEPPTGVTDDAAPDGREPTRPPVLVSACLTGEPCRWDGASRPLADLAQRLGGDVPLAVCPEVLAGLGVPRPPMSWREGDGRAALAGQARLIDADGRDCTAALLAGARRAVALAREAGCRRALLKERSPSCGVVAVHGERELIPGCGLFAALLERDGVQLASEEHPWPDPDADPVGR